MLGMSAHNSSPHSSHEVASNRGTPETRLTAFSPEDGRGFGSTPATRKSHSGSETSSSKKSYKDASETFTTAESDPFVSTVGSGFGLHRFGSARHGLMRFSPTAVEFTPSSRTVAGSAYADLLAAQLAPQGMKKHGAFGAHKTFDAQNIFGVQKAVGENRDTSPKEYNIPHTPAPLPMLPPESPASPVSPSPRRIDLPTQLPPIGQPLTTPGTPVNFGTFTSDDGLMRAIAVEHIHLGVSAEDIAEFFSVHQFPSLKAHVFSELSTKGNVYVAFADVRDTNLAFDKASTMWQWTVRRLNGTDFLTKSKPQLARFVSEFEGQVTIVVYCKFKDSRVHQNSTSPKLVQTMLGKYGEIKAFRTLVQGTEDGVSEFRAEFYDTRSADKAVLSLDTAAFGDFVLTLYHHRPDQPKYQQLDTMDDLSGGFGHIGLDELAVMNAASLPYTPKRRVGPVRVSESASGSNGRRRPPYLQLSPTGRSTIPRDGLESSPSPDGIGMMALLPATERPHGRKLGGQTQGLHRNQKSGKDNGQHNTVDVERIRLGLDVRTTIMLRNIPNKIDQAMLKSIVDETSHGKYDFMYLRIDFANNCNVGYAFINFEDPLYIIDFVKAKAGQRWNRFNSDKVAEVSYATIQGKDCLVQKFRNSSVMLEHPSFRPKIFFTGTGPMAGKEDKFPGPDNPSKMRRSVENAEHVGLFAPRAGQQFRDEQRRRRSNFDRGTRLAQVEDAMAVGHGWIEGEYWVRLPGSHQLVRVPFKPEHRVPEK